MKKYLKTVHTITIGIAIVKVTSKINILARSVRSCSLFILKAPIGVEPISKDLQSSAWPLG